MARESNRKEWPRDSRARSSSAARERSHRHWYAALIPLKNWRKIGPIAARRAKSFTGRSIVFESTRLLSAWGDNPRIRPYIEIVEFVRARARWPPPSAETQPVKLKLRVKLQEITDVFQFQSWRGLPQTRQRRSSEDRLSDLPQSGRKDDRPRRHPQSCNDEYLRLRPAHGQGPHDSAGRHGARTRDHRRGHRERPRRRVSPDRRPRIGPFQRRMRPLPDLSRWRHRRLPSR